MKKFFYIFAFILGGMFAYNLPCFAYTSNSFDITDKTYWANITNYDGGHVQNYNGDYASNANLITWLVDPAFVPAGSNLTDVKIAISSTASSNNASCSMTVTVKDLTGNILGVSMPTSFDPRKYNCEGVSWGYCEPWYDYLSVHFNQDINKYYSFNFVSPIKFRADVLPSPVQEGYIVSLNTTGCRDFYIGHGVSSNNSFVHLQSEDHVVPIAFAFDVPTNSIKDPVVGDVFSNINASANATTVSYPVDFSDYPDDSSIVCNGIANDNSVFEVALSNSQEAFNLAMTDATPLGDRSYYANNLGKATYNLIISKTAGATVHLKCVTVFNTKVVMNIGSTWFGGNSSWGDPYITKGSGFTLFFDYSANGSLTDFQNASPFNLLENNSPASFEAFGVGFNLYRDIYTLPNYSVDIPDDQAKFNFNYATSASHFISMFRFDKLVPVPLLIDSPQNDSMLPENFSVDVTGSCPVNGENRIALTGGCDDLSNLDYNVSCVNHRFVASYYYFSSGYIVAKDIASDSQTCGDYNDRGWDIITVAKVVVSHITLNEGGPYSAVLHQDKVIPATFSTEVASVKISKYDDKDNLLSSKTIARADLFNKNWNSFVIPVNSVVAGDFNFRIQALDNAGVDLGNYLQISVNFNDNFINFTKSYYSIPIKQVYELNYTLNNTVKLLKIVKQSSMTGEVLDTQLGVVPVASSLPDYYAFKTKSDVVAQFNYTFFSLDLEGNEVAPPVTIYVNFIPPTPVGWVTDEYGNLLYVGNTSDPDTIKTGILALLPKKNDCTIYLPTGATPSTFQLNLCVAHNFFVVTLQTIVMIPYEIASFTVNTLAGFFPFNIAFALFDIYKEQIKLVPDAPSYVFNVPFMGQTISFDLFSKEKMNDLAGEANLNFMRYLFNAGLAGLFLIYLWRRIVASSSENNVDLDIQNPTYSSSRIKKSSGINK